ncbi:MAG: pilus assembly protein TadG-related protein [Nocardioidaceae bacterium]
MRGGLLPRLAGRRGRGQNGYVAIVAAMFTLFMFGMAAFSVDVGRWYLTARETQRAADAAALAGVSYLPGNQTGAFAAAQDYATRNDMTNGSDGVVVTPAIGDSPTKLQVTVAQPVQSVFGSLLGIDSATITRSATADYAGPVPLGSPCNEYGNDPESSGAGNGNRSSNCSGSAAFWANVGSPGATKSYGDAYQDNVCTSSIDGCTDGTTNANYDSNGYFYTITLSEAVDNLAIEVYDPALINVGDACETQNSFDAKLATAAAGSDTQNPYVTDAKTRYAEGATSVYCNGDIGYSKQSSGYTGQVATNYTVRDPGPNPWDPTSYPIRGVGDSEATCEGTGVYPGYSGDLSKALDSSTTAYATQPAQTTANLAPAANLSKGYVASVFRQWVRICTISSASAGTYMIQVNTNGLGFDAASGHNRFAIRAYSPTDSTAKDSISVSGYQKMAMYGNLPGGTSTFHLARVPSGAAGQVLNVSLFDVGDIGVTGKIQVVAPTDSGVTFSDCKATGAYAATLSDCQLTNVNYSTYNGKWENIAVTIPSGFTCDDLDTTKCWVMLKFDFNTATSPSDTTSWTASIEGDPVRLIE